MRTGDFLEWTAGALAVAAALLATHMLWVAIGSAAVFLMWEAQCYGGPSHRLPKPSLPKLKHPGRPRLRVVHDERQVRR